MDPRRLTVEARPGGAVLAVWVQPRAAREGVVGVREGALHVRVAAPPEDGRANEAVRQLLAAALGVRRQDVQLLAGERARRKRVLVAGLSPEELRRRLTR